MTTTRGALHDRLYREVRGAVVSTLHAHPAWIKGTHARNLAGSAAKRAAGSLIRLFNGIAPRTPGRKRKPKLALPRTARDHLGANALSAARAELARRCWHARREDPAHHLRIVEAIRLLDEEIARKRPSAADAGDLPPEPKGA